jgi:ribosomal protein L16 Arg81 hydroxylase
MSPEILAKIKLEEPFYIKNALPSMFSWTELENLLNLRPFINDSRFIITNRSKEQTYQWPAQSWLSDINTFPPKLLHDIVNEEVCYLRDCTKVNKKINNIADTIEKATGWPVDAHIYFSKKIKHEGFGRHKDRAHNLIVQSEGKSNFKVWSKHGESEVINVDLEPGDCIFIPAKVYHKVLPLTPRVSVSLPMWILESAPAQDRYWISLTD